MRQIGFVLAFCSFLVFPVTAFAFLMVEDDKGCWISHDEHVKNVKTQAEYIRKYFNNEKTNSMIANTCREKAGPFQYKAGVNPKGRYTAHAKLCKGVIEGAYWPGLSQYDFSCVRQDGRKYRFGCQACKIYKDYLNKLEKK